MSLSKLWNPTPPSSWIRSPPIVTHEFDTGAASSIAMLTLPLRLNGSLSHTSAGGGASTIGSAASDGSGADSVRVNVATWLLTTVLSAVAWSAPNATANPPAASAITSPSPVNGDGWFGATPLGS